MKSDRSRYSGYRFPSQIISYAVWAYLDLRHLEDELRHRNFTVAVIPNDLRPEEARVLLSERAIVSADPDRYDLAPLGTCVLDVRELADVFPAEVADRIYLTWVGLKLRSQHTCIVRLQKTGEPQLTYSSEMFRVRNRIPLDARKVTEDYPGFVVDDERVSGSITLGHTRLSLWAVIQTLVEEGYAGTVEYYLTLPEDATAPEIGWFLKDLFEQRREFGRLLCVLADVERRERERRHDLPPALFCFSTFLHIESASSGPERA